MSNKLATQSLEDSLFDESGMARAIRDYPWGSTSIGLMQSWSPALRMMVRILLANRFPLLLWWGPDYISIYNDAYIPVLGTKHPWGLGRPVRECWSEIWHILKPLIDTPFRGGPSTWNEDIELEIRRNGFAEETHFTIAYSPVPDETAAGGIGGVLATVHEITEKVIAERRVGIVRDLAAHVGKAKTKQAACGLATQILDGYKKDIPFALIYLIDADGKRARLAGTAGVGTDDGFVPAVIDLDAAPWNVLPFGKSDRESGLYCVDRLKDLFRSAAPQLEQDLPQTAAILPIPSNVDHGLSGFFVAGINPRLKWGDAYRGFFELAATHIASAIAAAGIHEKETALRESEQRFRALVTATSDVVYRMSPDWIEMRNLYGQNFIANTDEPIHDWMEKYILPEEHAYVNAAIKKAIASKDMFQLEHRVRLPNGGYGWTFSRAIPILDAQGEIVEWFGAAGDITARKHAETALIAARDKADEAEKTLLSALEVGKIFVWNWNIKTGHVKRSAPAREILGIDDSHIDDFVARIHPEDREWVQAALAGVIGGEKMVRDIEFRFITNDGLRWLSCSGEVVYAATGAPSNFVGLAMDVTERKRAEEELMNARNKADQANSAKTDFLANMSHEIRTPMNAVVGLSSILSMDKALSGRQKEMVNTLQLSAESLLKLINDLLDISKIETSQIALERIPFTFKDIIDEVFDVLAIKARENGIALDRVESPVLTRRFIGDPLRIKQILMNLVSNAVKFTKKGGVTVSAMAGAPNEEATVDVRVMVADTGIGIPSHQLDGIFDKFTQVDTSTTRKYGGTGLGLAISKNLAEIMGGALTVKSEDGHGSEFTLHLPLKLAIKDDTASRLGIDAPDIDPLVTDPQGLILLVEDYKPNVLVAETMLEMLGYRCDVVSTGRQALDKLRVNRGKYSAVLMDVQMPDMDGLSATRIIREEENAGRLPHLRIIAMTAHALRGDKDRCLEAGMDDYISKPFQALELKEKLLNVAK